MKIPEIPPFRGGQQQQQQQQQPLQRTPNQPNPFQSKTAAAQPPYPQQAAPAPLNLPQKPSYTSQHIQPLISKELPRHAARHPDYAHHSSSYFSSSSYSSNNNPLSFPTPAPANPNGDLDALNDVIFPALEEALKRRQIRLQQVFHSQQQQYHHQQNQSQNQQQAQAAATVVTPAQQRAEAAHDKIRKLVYKLAHVCKEIDHFDKAEPVGMGKEVPTFLEGLLEEILVRVEPLDEEDGGVGGGAGGAGTGAAVGA
jgi:serine/threonine-protein kinase 24/25/MST4